MGGSASEEFLAPIEVGEDTFVRCTSCDYAANVEAVRVPAPEPCRSTSCRGVVHDTPDTPTIQTLVDLLNARDDLRRADGRGRRRDTLKNVDREAEAPGRPMEPLAIGARRPRRRLKRLEARSRPPRRSVHRRRTSPAPRS
jgi:prolyl-tRNA synthetase